MYKGKKVLAIIPARGGSKGIKKKNLVKLAGIPLIGYISQVLNKINIIDFSLVSTDCEKISNMSIKFNLNVPFKRPKSLSGDKISDIDVMCHALKKIEKIKKSKFDVIVLLQPTSPLRKHSDVIKAIKKLVDYELDSVWTVSKTDSKFHPLKQLVLKKTSLLYYDKLGKDIIARQQLSDLYHRNGVAYAITRECLLKQKKLLGKKNGFIIIKRFLANIDNQDDLDLAEFYIKKENEKKI